MALRLDDFEYVSVSSAGGIVASWLSFATDYYEPMVSDIHRQIGDRRQVRDKVPWMCVIIAQGTCRAYPRATSMDQPGKDKKIDFYTRQTVWLDYWRTMEYSLVPDASMGILHRRRTS